LCGSLTISKVLHLAARLNIAKAAVNDFLLVRIHKRANFLTSKRGQGLVDDLSFSSRIQRVVACKLLDGQCPRNTLSLTKVCEKRLFDLWIN